MAYHRQGRQLPVGDVLVELPLSLCVTPEIRIVLVVAAEIDVCHRSELWVGDTVAAKIIGSVNLNGVAHPLDRPLAVTTAPAKRFKGTFPGNMVVSRDGKFLYVVDQGAFQVNVLDTTKIVTGLDANGLVTEPDNFGVVVNRVAAGRYPFGIGLSADSDELSVSNVRVFQYTHLMPDNPVGDANADYPLCYPAVGYPEETLISTTIQIKKVDPRNLPASQRDAAGIRCGYVGNDITYRVAGLGDPNVKASSSVYVMDVHNPGNPQLKRVLKPGLLVGQVEDDFAAYSGSHPNAVARTRTALFVANGNNDTISVYAAGSFKRLADISLGDSFGRQLVTQGIQPVALEVSPDQRTLYVAEVGINAVAVVDIDQERPSVIGHIPAGWWPSSLKLSADGRTLYIANAKGRGAGPDNEAPPDNGGSPKYSTDGTVNFVSVPHRQELKNLIWTSQNQTGLLAVSDQVSAISRNSEILTADSG